MPWIIDGKNCVRRKSTGDIVQGGCHATREEAEKHMRALYANAKEKGIMAEPSFEVYPPDGIYTFSDLDAALFAEGMAVSIEKLNDSFMRLVENIMQPGVEGQEEKIKNLMNEYRMRLSAYTQQPVDAAPKSKSLIARIVDAFRVKQRPAPPITFTKGKNGMRWLAVFTNNFRDVDYPPEILSAEAHRQFVKEVDAGIWPMPELWQWHIDGTRYGVADFVDFDESSGFAIAGGTIDKGKEHIAEAVRRYHENVEPLGVSHGMPGGIIRRDSEDPSIITRYASKEISTLPARAAANPLTEITIGKESNMNQAKKEYLKTQGYSEDQIAELEQRLLKQSAAAKAAGIESKEAAMPPVGEKKPEAEDPEEKDPEEEEGEEEKGPEEEKSVTNVTVKEIADAVVQAIAPLKQRLDEQSEAITDLKQRLEASEAKTEERVKEALESTPPASLGAMIAAKMRAVGTKETEVDGRSSLMKSAPKMRTNGNLPFDLDAIVN